MSSLQRTPVKTNEKDEGPRGGWKVAGLSKDQERPMEKVWFVDKMEVCKTCKLRVDTRDMGLECDVCKVWAHTKCEKITKEEYKAFEKKHSPFSWICKECKEIDFVSKFERVENTMVMVRKEMKEMRDLLIEKVEKSMEGKVKEMEKNVVEQVKGMMMEVLQRMETEVNEIKSTTESMKREIKKVKAEQDEMRSMIAEELKEREEKTEKRMNEIMRGKTEIEGKQLDEVKRVVIKESLKEIKKEKEEDERKIERIYGKVEQMEREQKKKKVVVYNLPESESEEARERYRDDEEACRTIFEGIGVQQVEQKQLIRLGKREENKTRPVLVKLGKEENAREILMKAKRLRNSEQYSRIFIAKDQSKEEREKEKNLRLELKELREKEGEWYTIKKGKIVKESEARGRGIYRGGYRGRGRRGGRRGYMD